MKLTFNIRANEVIEVDTSEAHGNCFDVANAVMQALAVDELGEPTITPLETEEFTEVVRRMILIAKNTE